MMSDNNEAIPDSSAPVPSPPSPPSDSSPSEKTAYCVRCRQKVPLVNPTVKFNNRGVKMLQAVCPNANCGSKVNTFVKKDAQPALPDSAIAQTDESPLVTAPTKNRKKQKTTPVSLPSS